MNYQNQNPFENHEPLSFDQITNAQNTYSQKEEEVKSEIDIQIRLGFIRKVFGILSFQLIITSLMTYCAMAFQSFKDFIFQDKTILILSFAALIIIMFVLCCCQGIMRQVPLNYIIMLIFTLSMSYLVAGTCALADPKIVFMAALMTCVMVISLTIYAIYTSTDFTMQGGLFFIVMAASLLFCIFGIFIRVKIILVIICLCGVIIFSLYLIYDIQLIIGNRKDMILVDDYMFAALNIYLDIINIFLYLLRLFNLLNDN